MGTILSLWTVVVLLVFLAIVAWAWSGGNKARFEAAARIPLDDDDDTNDIPEVNKDG